MRNTLIGLAIGAAIAAMIYPIFLKRELEQNRLISDNGDIERMNRIIAVLDTKLTPQNGKITRNFRRKQRNIGRRNSANA